MVAPWPGALADGGPCIGTSGQISTLDPLTGSHAPIVTGLFSLLDPEGGAIGIDGLSTEGFHLFGIMGIFPQAFEGADCSQIPNAPADCAQVLATAQSQAGALLKFGQGGSWTEVANPGAVGYQFTADNPGGSTYGTEVDANPYGVLSQARGSYVADAGANTLDWVSNSGAVSIVYRFPVPNPEEPFPTDAVPTCVAGGNGHLTVADFAGRIWAVNGAFVRLIQGQTGDHYTGCASDSAGNVYVVSMFHGLFPNPGTGSILKVSRTQSVSTVSGTDGLVFPNGIATGRDGSLYVSVNSVCTTAPPNPCGGETGGVVKVTP